MKDRIKKFMNNLNITAAELADSIGVQRSNISHVLNGRNNPSSAFLEKLLQHFPDLDARWLLTGTGEMVKESTKKISKDLFTASLSVSSDTKQQPKTTHIPVDPTNREILDTVGEVKQLSRGKEIEKVILFYSDKTFDVYKIN